MSDDELKELRERLTLAKALGHVDVDAEVADALLAEIDFRREENATIQYFADQDKEEIDRLRAQLAIAVEELECLIRNVGGHEHWDREGTRGINCPLCQQQTGAQKRAREALAKLKEGK